MHRFFKRAVDVAGGALSGLALASMIGLAVAQGFVLGNNTVWQGHFVSAQPATQTPPAATACGTTPSLAGTDLAGTVTMGTTATGCVITFAAAYATAPNCLVVWQGTPLAAQNYTVSATAITTVQTSTTNNKLNYWCTANVGG